jgi:hypothetical protein
MSRTRQVVLVAALCGSAVVLASCGFPAAGGIVAGGAMLVALIVGALSLGSTAGCVCKPCLSIDPPRTHVCLSIAPVPPSDGFERPTVSGQRTKVMACLSPPIRLRPCLSQPKISPCLQPPTRVGPCLSDVVDDPPPRPRRTPKRTPEPKPRPKMRACLSVAPPARVCLSIAPPDDSQSLLETPHESRVAVVDRLHAAGVISEEQAARIKRLRG